MFRSALPSLTAQLCTRRSMRWSASHRSSFRATPTIWACKCASSAHAPPSRALPLRLAVMQCARSVQCAQCTRRKDDLHREKLLLFERCEGGAGLVRGLARNFGMLVRHACRTIEGCLCESGCPSCIHLSCCGEYNEFLSKAGALALLKYFVDRMDNQGTAGIVKVEDSDLFA